MQLKPTFASLLLTILVVVFSSDLASAEPLVSKNLKANFTQCILNIRNESLIYPPNNPLNYTLHLFDLDGRATSDRSTAISADYATCKAHCGTSYGEFQWSLFSQQFTGWLLPFLALTAQLPYESDGTWHDLMSLFLSVSSPPLAMYSLSLTILNSRYVKRRLDELFLLHPDPRRQHMLEDLKTRIFQSLRFSQQQAFELGSLGAHHPALDDVQKIGFELQWWKALQETLTANARSLTASLATQSAWAFVAFSFTWMDALGSEKIGTNVTAYGLAIALSWSWLMVVVLGWFFAGVSLSRQPMTGSIERANEAHPKAPKRLAPYAKRRDPSHYALSRNVSGDANRAGPLYNYARVFVWSYSVDRIMEMIRLQILTVSGATSAQEHSPIREETESGITKVLNSPSEQPDEKRFSLRPLSMGDAEGKAIEGTADRYLWEEGTELEGWKRAVYSRMFWSAASAIVLSVATVGSAFWLDYLTPSVGLGCRSGGILIYWMTSYVIWISMVLSARLSDSWSVHEAAQRIQRGGGGQRPSNRYALGVLAVSLRILGKTLAVLNTVWILLHSLFEFTRFYNRCYCQTNRGRAVWLFLEFVEIRDLYNVRDVWVGLAILTGGVCTIYLAFMGFWTSRRF